MPLDRSNICKVSSLKWHRWRYAKKFAPLDSTAIYPKSGNALLYTTLDRWNEMPYNSYLCLAHSISSSQMLMLHKHQSPSSLFDHHHESTLGLIFLEWIWSTLYYHVTLLVHRSQLRLVFTIALVHRRQAFAQAFPPHVVFRFKASNLPFTLATGPSTQSLVSIFSI